MFNKLRKYDMKAVSKLWWIGAVVSLAASVVGAVLIRFFIQVSESETENVFLVLISVLGAIVGFFCIIAIVLSFVLTLVLIFARFYKNFFTDEGYLTFTLPVKRSALLLSKTVNAMIWFCAHYGIIIVSLGLFLLLVSPPEEGGSFINPMIFEGLAGAFEGLWSTCGPWLIVYIAEALIIAFIYVLFSIILIHFCITFGSVIAKKAKVIVSIGIYYGISWVVGALWQFGAYFFAGFMSSGMSILMEDATKNQIFAIYALLIMVVAAILATICAALYSITQYMIDRKLNLA